MIRKTLVLVLIAAFTFACATTDDDPNKKTKRGAVIGAVIARVPIGAVVKELWPFYLVALTVLLLMSYVPALTIY